MQRLMIRKPDIYKRMSEASFSPGVALTLLIALGLYIVYFLLREIPANIIDLIYYSGQAARNQTEAEKVVYDYVNAPGTMLASLALMSVLPTLIMIYVRKMEKRPLSTIGIVRPVLSRFALGYLGGLALFLLAVLPVFLNGTAQYKGIAPVAALFIFGYIVQAVAEEAFFRGYVLSCLTAKTGALPAVLISSALFAGLCIWNSGASGLMIPVLFLSGIVYVFLTLRTGSIWAAAGMHAAQSFTFGLVSPVKMESLATDYSVMSLQTRNVDIYALVCMAACIIITASILFAGENRLAVPLSDARRMYLEARKSAKYALTGVSGEDGVPMNKFAFSIAAAVQSDEAKAAALLYTMRLSGVGFDETVYSAGVLETVNALSSHAGVSKNETALEIKHAAEKCGGALKERYKKYASHAERIYCPLLRRQVDEPRCEETMNTVDSGDRTGLFGMMDLEICAKCSQRNSG